MGSWQCTPIDSIEYKLPQELQDKIKNTAEEQESRMKHFKERLAQVKKTKSVTEMVNMWSEFLTSPSLNTFTKFIENMHESTLQTLQYRLDIKSTVGEEKYEEFMKLLSDHWTLLGKTENVIKTTKETAQYQHNNINEILLLLEDNKNIDLNKEEIIEEYTERMQILSKWIEEEHIEKLQNEWAKMRNKLQKMYEFWVNMFKQTWYSWGKWILKTLVTGIACAFASIAVIGYSLINVGNINVNMINEKQMFEFLMSQIKDELTKGVIMSHIQSTMMALTGIALIQFAYSFYKGYQTFQTIINDANDIQSSLHQMVKHASNMENHLNDLQSKIGKNQTMDQFISLHKNKKNLKIMKQSLQKLKDYLMEYINQSQIVMIQVHDSRKIILHQLLNE